MGMVTDEVKLNNNNLALLYIIPNDVNTITIYDVPFEIRRLCDLICKFRLDGNLYDIYYYEVSS